MKRTLWLFLICINVSFYGYGQKKAPAKYPSLFWEITGNGLKKPSYLFGTMHVSSKMVFHLSDSFYTAIRNVDAVALELNPDVWQGQMVDLDNLKQNYAEFAQAPGGDYLNEHSFRISKYDDELKLALSTEPTVVNSLLYRSYKAKEDFEEDTFLDLYIFQTGKKLGKRATGVEHYFETEKLIMEAYADMSKEKKKRTVDMDGESGEDIQEKLQDAYRRGDLDLMDSLDRMMERSDAFREKFLYKRNEIQAGSIDTIIQKSSLFVGVGAAHLAGNRGVIELLRKKGYKLRPIMMADRDASQKEAIDKVKVPVEFKTQHADDGFYSVSMPGPLFKLVDENSPLDRRQYSDMSNGAYYLVTRVKTHAAFLGQNEEAVLKKVDSVLYENIPGKILSKKKINRNGYPGYDILNRTRRGDLQRYNIFVTPFEVLVFKMSGNENYAEGKEADQFFSSIQLKEGGNTPVVFEPKQGGFSVKFPQAPDEYLDANIPDNNERWEYEAQDQATGNAYLVFKKSINNFRFLDEDSFDLSMIEESFRGADMFDRQLQRKPGSFNGYPCLDVKEKLKDGSELAAKYIIRGPQYYVLAIRGNLKKNEPEDYFNSFRFTSYRYPPPTVYVDTFMHFSASTPVVPDLDQDMRALIEKTTADIASGNSFSGYIPYWPKPKNGLFKSDSTGEVVGVSVQEFPKYYFLKDPVHFWRDELASYYKGDLVLYRSEPIKSGDMINGYRFTLRDTGSSRAISRMLLLKDNYLFSMVSLGDTLSSPGNFTATFFDTFRPQTNGPGKNIFDNRLDDFFSDLFSNDSIIHERARQSISNIYYGEKGVPGIMNAISRLSISEKDYFDTKSRLIAELGYIRDTLNPRVVNDLKGIYKQVGDTSTFQMDVLLALIRHKTTDAYTALRDIIVQEPPIFENSYDYTSLFNRMDDSLKLAAQLFPQLLDLASVDDYKENVIRLFGKVVDSGFIPGPAYENYFPKIYFDARIHLKKQLSKDEAQMMEDNKKTDENSRYPIRYNYQAYEKSGLDVYSVLLVPYYDKNPNVPRYFDKLLGSRDPDIRLHTVVLLLRNNKVVADSILDKLVANDQSRAALYTALEKAGRLGKFPVKFKNQLDMAGSLLLGDKDYHKIDSLVFLTRQHIGYMGKKGMVYFFKYRVKKEDDWKIGISGLQPDNEKEVSSNDQLVTMTDKKLKADEPQEKQLQAQLKKLLFNLHKSGKYFFNADDSYTRVTDYGD